MTDPDGLTTAQRMLVNAAHEAIVRSSAIAAHPRALVDTQFDDHATALSEAKDALAAAHAARVPRSILERTIRAASAIGREHAGG